MDNAEFLGSDEPRRVVMFSTLRPYGARHLKKGHPL